MYNLLVVDDIPAIVDGVCEMVEASELPLQLFRAYSAREAMEQLRKTPMDIVLTDINMPEINGISLLSMIMAYWSRCKVIFLSSYDSFEYAQEAISKGAYGYILKMHGDERIVEVLQNACGTIAQELEDMNVIAEAKHKLRLAMPTLQREYLKEILDGRKSAGAKLDEAFRELDLSLDPGKQLYLIMGRVDAWNKDYIEREKSLLRYAAQNIAEEYLMVSGAVLTVPYDQNRIVWLIQMSSRQEREQTESEEGQFLVGTVERIQTTCKNLLKLTLSFAISPPLTWAKVSEGVMELKGMMSRGLGLDKELILHARLNKERTDAEHIGSAKLNLAQLTVLEECLESGQVQAFFSMLSSVMQQAESSSDSDKLLLYHSCSSMYLRHIQRLGLQEEVRKQELWSAFVRFDALRGWSDVEEHFRRLAILIFEFTHNERAELHDELIRAVNSYIEKHVKDDLSLYAIAEHVHLNASYLSRLYKQVSGSNLSDTISKVRMNNALQLLKQSHIKVQDIALELGYQSSLSFIRFFKGQTGMTPQEYRETVLRTRK